MKRIAMIATVLILAAAILGVPRMATEAQAHSVPPQSTAFGKTLTEWMQLYHTWSFGGGEDHVGHVKFLPLPMAAYAGGSFTYADPGILVGHLDVTLKPGTPFVLPVTIWYGERYLPELSYPDDPALPAGLFTDPSKNHIAVYIDGKPVMDSTRASVSQFYFGPAPINVNYPQPSPYGSTAAIFVQGIGFVHEPLSVGTHTIELVAGLQIPADPTILNLNIYPDGSGARYINSWKITVSPH